jgi:hypothetical protein
MAGSQIPTSVTIINSLKGFQSVSLTEYNTSAAAAVAAGSVCEIAGAFFTFVSDEAINASSWTAIVTGTTAYITLTPSGTAGSQIVDVAYTSTAPTWRDDHQGWYASAASNVRVIGSVYKAEAANYGPKYLYDAMQDNRHKLASLNVNSATVVSSLSVGGSVIISSSLSVYGKCTLSGQSLNNYYYSNSLTNFSVLNTQMLPVTPVTNSTIIVNGTIQNNTLGTTITSLYAVRDTPTSMTFYGYDDIFQAQSISFTGATQIARVALVW